MPDSHPHAPAVRLEPHLRRVLPAVLIGSFLAVTDLFIVTVALPSIGRSLAAGPAALELVLAGYSIAYACCLVAGGRLGDLLGRRPLFLGGMAAFVLTSAGCGLAPSVTVLVGARIAQGVAAAAMVPQVLATIRALCHGPARARALGLFGAVIGTAIVFGQVSGGVITSADLAGLGWRPVFLLNVPIGVAGWLLALRRVPETRAPGQRAGLDWWGAALLAGALGGVLAPVVLAQRGGWSAWHWSCLAVAPLAAAALAAVERWRERRGRVVLLPPALLALPGMRRGLLVAVSYFPGAGGFLFTSALVAQDGLGHTPLAAGLALAPYAVAFLVASLLARRLTARHGHRVITGGALLLAAALAGLAVQVWLAYPDLSATAVVPLLALTGAGNALVMIPMFEVVLARVPAASAGAASGVLTTTQQAGLGLGAAVLGALLLGVARSGAGWARGGALVCLVEAVLAGLTAVAAQALTRTVAALPPARPEPVSVHSGQ
ncbi:MFS transporter [Goodfellowiella coeruleoviolacea]|uniref:Major Facilitator Superfamily protein n=1 Tax=Goodfellowiella coeruleoviolacea TaxID=334858 RepID=A0AAE3KJQ0_9PSEU|nr:MFS transporter [Goodfellowiella coeruleoviolacea]MCP2169327.1 Major Facilitator Superfamily protein [Goodfellowiella coeruleoviolacea]